MSSRIRYARSAKKYRARGTVAIAAVSRIFHGRVCLSSYGRQSAGFTVEIPRAAARSSVSDCPESHAFTDVKPIGLRKLYDWSVTWRVAVRASDFSIGCP